MTKRFMAAAVAAMLALNTVVSGPATVKAEVSDMQEMSSEDVSSEELPVTENVDTEETEDIKETTTEMEVSVNEIPSEEIEDTSASVEEVSTEEEALVIETADIEDTEEIVSSDDLEDVTDEEAPTVEYTFSSMEEYNETCQQDTDDWKYGVYQGTKDVIINFTCDVELNTPLQIPNANAVINIAGNFTKRYAPVSGADVTINCDGNVIMDSAVVGGDVKINCMGDFYLNYSLAVTGDTFTVNADNIYLNGFMPGNAKTESFHAKGDIHVEENAGFVIKACDYYLHAEGTTYLEGNWQGAASTSVLHFSGNTLNVKKDGNGMYGASFDLNTINLETNMEIGGFGSADGTALVSIKNATIYSNGHTLAVCYPDISNCTFIGNGEGTGLSTDPSRKEQTGNQSSGAVKDTTFTGYQTAVSVAGCKLDITKTEITRNGIKDLSSADASQGVYVDISGKINASGLTVKNVSCGVDAAQVSISGQVTGENPEDETSIIIGNSSFENVLIGIRGGGYINHCSIKGAENAEAGIKLSNTHGSLIINSTIDGFEYGVYSGKNSYNDSYNSTAYLLGNCKIANVDIGCHIYQGEMHACQIDARKVGVYCGVDVAITDSKITGTKEDGSKGIVSATSVQIGTRKDGVILYPSGDEGQFLDSNRNGHTFNNATLALLDEVREGNEISNFDTGYLGAGGRDHYGFIKVYNCNIGIASASDSNYASDEVEIYDCEVGLSGGELRWVPYQTDHMNIKIHDCETGITNTTLWMNESDKNKHLLEIYNCTDAIVNNKLNGYLGNTYIHDCERGLSCLNGVPYLSSDLLIEDCTEKNLYYAAGRYLHMPNHTDFKSINNVGGYAVYIEDGIMTDSNDLQLAPKTWETKGIVYLGEGSRFDVGGKNAPSKIDQYIGDILLDFNEYEEGRLVFQGTGSSGTSYNLKLDDGEYYNPNTVYDFSKVVWMPYSDEVATENLYDQHRIFTIKEGWVVVPETVEQTFELPINDTEKVSISEINTTKGTVKTQQRTGNLILAAGCNVTYDYETNGGSSFSGDSNIISYKANDEIDMGYTATKAGYTFVGWSTSPNAKAASGTIIAGTTNITLYAIFKKEVPVTYHTENGTYEDFVTFYNNDDTLIYKLDEYRAATYSTVGYTLDITDKDNLLKAGEEVSVELSGLDVYCVYEKKGRITYLDEDGEFFSDDSISDIFAVEDTEHGLFHYPLIEYEATRGHIFKGWYDVTNKDKEVINGGIYTADSNNVTVRALVDEKRVKWIEVTPKQVAIDVSESFKLNVTIGPDDAYNQAVTWYSEDETIATVDEAGKVTGKKPGVVKIYAKTEDGSGLTDYSEITVKQYAVHYDYETNGGTSMDEVRTNYALHETIDVNVKAYKPDYEFVGWNTDKDAKAGLLYLTESGNEITLYAIYKKNVDVTYHTYKGTYRREAAVYNNETEAEYKLESFTSTGEEKYVTVGYTKDASSVEELLETGDTITVPQAGIDIYYVYDKIGTLIYLDTDGKYYKKTSDKKRYTSEDVVRGILTYTLISYEPSYGHTFTGWREINEDTLYQTGETYTTADTDMYMQAVEDEVKASSIKVSPKEPTIEVGESKQLKAEVGPENALDKSVTWWSEDDSIVTVDEMGKITGKKPGKARVYAKTNDGSDLTDYADVTVKEFFVTYNYEENGGSSMDQASTEFNRGDTINVDVKAYKNGWIFVGWNTDKNAKTGLKELVGGGENITLYAIYKKNVDVTYHTYSKDGNYTDTIAFYNKETDKDYTLLNFEVDTPYCPAGYILSPEITDNSVIYQPNDTINIQGATDIYYVYRCDGNITYLDETGNIYLTESITSLYVADTVTNASFTHHLKQYQPQSGYTFSGWEYKGKQYQAGTDLTTNQTDIVVKAVVTKNEEELVIEDPKKEPDKPKPNDKAPKTSDVNYPLEAAILLSGSGTMLLFLYLLMKKKR